ncbi:hypothetical protein J437_LFUL012686 [Ladona fulva]|uniref:Uncharacterized protein n=1 Tax=Ladona fulva TaxID=123851 RepID=A0A8K0KEG2_LADFU|nr:hypothetical protein J437_LFUL012686 [Ladona fulva]
MPRCLMAKKWKYPWDREKAARESEATAGETKGSTATEEEARSPSPTPWGPSSPTAGATAPSPPPNAPGTPDRVAVLYNAHSKSIGPSPLEQVRCLFLCVLLFYCLVYANNQ